MGEKTIMEFEKERSPAPPARRPEDGRALMNVRDLVYLSGRDALNYILDQAQPRAVVQSMSRVDFYWLVKQVGEEDALPLLRLASAEQWEHILDMEIWERDRISPANASSWVGKLLDANPGALVSWLYEEGEFFCYHFFFHDVEVEVKRGEEALDLPDGFFTLDNIYYVRVREKKHEDLIGKLLRRMAEHDYHRYQSLLLTLSGVIPAELEEELYRRRNVRLAEDGFLPFEEAVSLYSYVKPETVARSCPAYLLDLPLEDESTAVPFIPFSHANPSGPLVAAAERISDPILLDRLRLEFAGLCNQMVSADQIRISGMDELLETCRKAAGYLNLGLDELAGGRLDSAEEFLRLHPLILIFQVGFSLTLELKWDAERWMGQAWFVRMNFEVDFWGDEWGGAVEAILRKRPLYFSTKEGGVARPFESLPEVHQSRSVLNRIFAMDSLLSILHSLNPSGIVRDPLITFHHLLFTFWARKSLGLESGFEPISLDQLKSLLGRLRKGEKPYSMEEYGPVFIDDLLQCGGEGLGDWEKEVLKETLSGLWDDFSGDYARVDLADMKGRFSRFILIRTEMTDAPR